MKLSLSRYIKRLLLMPLALSTILLGMWYLTSDTAGSPTAVQAAKMLQIEPTAEASQTPVTDQGGPGTDQGTLIDTLRKSYPGIMPVDTINQPFMSVPGTNLRLADEPFPVVQVYEYTDEAAAKKDASKIQPNGDITGYHVGWIAQPHFYQAGRIIVIYLGKDPAILSALEAVVGKPFAVGEDVASPPATPISTPPSTPMTTPAPSSVPIPGVPKTGAPGDNILVWSAVGAALVMLGAVAIIRRRKAEVGED